MARTDLFQRTNRLAPSKHLSLLVTALLTGYLSALLAWFLFYRFSGDRFALVSLISMLAIYFFLPLPLAGIWVVRRRQAPLLGLWLLNGVVFVSLWGGYFLPKFPPRQQPQLKLLTYNVLGWNEAIAAQVETIRSVDADVVFLQELNPRLAALLEAELSEQYPYRFLEAQPGVDGMGTLSKYPLRRAGKVPPLGWVGEPQWLRLSWQGCEIDLMNVHMAPTNFFDAAHIHYTNALRQAQARWIVAQLSPERPFIVGGDTNSVPLSDSYRILDQAFDDAWRVSGWGLGHTFPGRDGPGSSRPQVFGLSVPQWLLRIDYLFYTAHFRATQAELAAFDGISDHRGVWASLAWLGACQFSQP